MLGAEVLGAVVLTAGAGTSAGSAVAASAAGFGAGTSAGFVLDTARGCASASARRRAFRLPGFPGPVSIPCATRPAGAGGTPGSVEDDGGAVRPLERGEPAVGLREKTETTGITPVVGSAARICLRVMGAFAAVGGGASADIAAIRSCIAASASDTPAAASALASGVRPDRRSSAGAV